MQLMMSRFYLRLMLIPILLFTATLLLTHAQPYDDHELYELLLPEGCPAPCFMGIRPGVTTENKALEILRASEWVHNLTQYCIYAADCRADGYEITWSDKAPLWINHKVSSKLLTWDSNIVSEFFIMTTDELHFFDIYDSDSGQLTMVQKVLAIQDNSSLSWKEAIEISASRYKLRFMSNSYISVCRQNLSDFLAFPISVITVGNDIKYGADYSGEEAASLRDVIINHLWNKYCLGI